MGSLEPYNTNRVVFSPDIGSESDTYPFATLAHPPTPLAANGQWMVAVLSPTVTFPTATQVVSTLTSQDNTRVLSGDSAHFFSVPVLEHSGTSVSTVHTLVRSVQKDLWDEVSHPGDFSLELAGDSSGLHNSTARFVQQSTTPPDSLQESPRKLLRKGLFTHPPLSKTFYPGTRTHRNSQNAGSRVASDLRGNVPKVSGVRSSPGAEQSALTGSSPSKVGEICPTPQARGAVTPEPKNSQKAASDYPGRALYGNTRCHRIKPIAAKKSSAKKLGVSQFPQLEGTPKVGGTQDDTGTPGGGKNTCCIQKECDLNTHMSGFALPHRDTKFRWYKKSLSRKEFGGNLDPPPSQEASQPRSILKRKADKSSDTLPSSKGNQKRTSTVLEPSPTPLSSPSSANFLKF
jgi:hypothetical protein